MANLEANRWFTEISDRDGSAFSLRVNKKLDEIQSPFQKVEMFETTDFGNLMIIDGCTMVSTRENFFYHEMMSHPALFSHPAPKNVVIIGGGDCGTLREVLKHPGVETVTQIDIDEVVTQMSLKYFPELCESNNDPRATVMFDDGIKYMREAPAESIDVIIVDGTDPVGPGEGLFNHAFYKSCLAALRTGGIMIQQSESPLMHMPLLLEMRDAMLEVGFVDLQTLPFPQPIYPSGLWSATMARKDEKFAGFREQDVDNATFDTEYYNTGIHKGALATPNFMKRAFEK
ncbi:polyamine aminopropyltransferase [Pseudoalteromonas sp. McH1-7]|uniref:Polyamine aminopropyltransferase n=1 Tax=Pseudoalteromonas peptidolytica F12-50-A1 TaxID=1315280 RepID=A0A8I0T312_9GAMM|nr:MULTISPECIES: polyamine aminopropyltransferase [Pseudoalteromonas]MBE0344792.1 spermidine synthase [Pseudoalteromonas peptidolytica F12-50-A1]MDW7551164.1 polyamine aminopropyltransferase [Pseudoalteromonas peptidolytica]NLR14515.1 polyamine aminopropyltransferase [Pseudoalteromonas peptidolytica]NUZ12957.1 polyamine aminopropyltransferase [Pseudoalteromonas sp. McH1-7]RRS10303.1 polyamine aminopropyltransferase [Pseudoalteromonas sp. J010]